MGTPDPPDSRSPFYLDGGLRALTTLLMILGSLLFLSGLTLTLNSSFALLARLAVGLLLVFTGYRLRRGSRVAAMAIVGVFALLAVNGALNGLRSANWRDLLPILMAIAFTTPIVRRWRSFV